MKFTIILIITFASFNLYGRATLPAFVRSVAVDNGIVSKVMQSFLTGSAIVVIACNSISCSHSSHKLNDSHDNDQQENAVLDSSFLEEAFAASATVTEPTDATPIADHQDIGAYTLHVGDKPGVKYLLGQVQQVYSDDTYTITIIANFDFGDEITFLENTYQLSVNSKIPLEHGGFVIGTIQQQQ